MGRMHSYGGGKHLQVRQEGPHSFSDSCHPQGLPQDRSGQEHDRLRMLKAHGLSPEILEDVYHLNLESLSFLFGTVTPGEEREG